MRPAKNIEKLIRNAAIHSDSEVNQAVLRGLLKGLPEAEEQKLALAGPNIRRIIMKSPIAKLAAAAVIIVAVTLLITVVDKLTSPAYAIEQTVEAFKNVQYMHVVRRDKAWNIEDERWIEIGPDGIQARYRQDTPERNFFVVDDRQTVMVHHPDKNTVVLYDANDKCWTWIYAPGKVFQELADGGPNYYTVEENVHYKGRPAHHLRWVVADIDIYIDPETKLPIAHGDYEIDYDEEPPEGTFEIVIPDGVVVVDKRPGAPPCEEPEWMIEEKKKEKKKKEIRKIAQGYFEDARRALAGGDPVRAAELFNKTIEISPGRNWAWLWMGIALYESGNYDAAIYRLSKAIDMIADPSYHFARGLAYQAKGMTDMARLDIEKVLPKMILALRNRRAASSFDLADDPLICADGMREGCHGMPTKEQSSAMMINRLRIITGQNFGYDPYGSNEENEQAIAAWEEWYENSGEIEFAPDAELVPIPEVVEQPGK